MSLIVGLVAGFLLGFAVGQFFAWRKAVRESREVKKMFQDVYNERRGS